MTRKIGAGVEPAWKLYRVDTGLETDSTLYSSPFLLLLLGLAPFFQRVLDNLLLLLSHLITVDSLVHFSAVE